MDTLDSKRLLEREIEPQHRQSPPRESILQRIRRMTLPAAVTAALLLAVNAVARKDCVPHASKPNFVFIMTDDQDLHLNSLDYQPHVNKHIVEKGTKFNKHFCTVSLCCPSRVSLLTGKAAHNTNVTDVNPPYGGFPKFVDEGLNEAYLPVWLQQAGYNTYYTGKLMNKHGINTYNKPFAAGWNRSDFLLDPGTYRYLNAFMSLDYEPYRSIEGKYSTDVVGNRSLEFLDDALNAKKPFFLGITPVGPHGEDSPQGFDAPIPAERHKHLFPDVKVPRVDNFNPEKPGDVHYFKNLPRLNSSQIAYADNFYRRRLQALQSVDEIVHNVVTALESHPDVLANTYIIYTSDNGYHIGNHRLSPGKTCNIEEDVNVPFAIRGPGITPGQQISLPTSHTDIVPTLFQLAGIPLHQDFDGIPMAVTAKSQATNPPRHEHVNIEFWGRGVIEGTVFQDLVAQVRQNTYKTLRIVAPGYEFMYAVWCTNEHQLYDMTNDPYQLTNLIGNNGKTNSGFDIGQVTARLDALLLTLKSCKGKQCREPWSELFPAGEVNNLQDAMASEYDDFFAGQPNVTFSQCAKGYITEYEGALHGHPFGEPTRRWEDYV